MAACRSLSLSVIFVPRFVAIVFFSLISFADSAHLIVIEHRSRISTTLLSSRDDLRPYCQNGRQEERGLCRANIWWGLCWKWEGGFHDQGHSIGNPWAKWIQPVVVKVGQQPSTLGCGLLFLFYQYDCCKQICGIRNVLESEFLLSCHPGIATFLSRLQAVWENPEICEMLITHRQLFASRPFRPANLSDLYKISHPLTGTRLENVSDVSL